MARKLVDGWVVDGFGQALAGHRSESCLALGSRRRRLATVWLTKTKRNGVAHGAGRCRKRAHCCTGPRRTAGTAGYDLVHIERVASRSTVLGAHLALAGWGVYLALIGAVIALVAMAIEYVRG